MSRIVYRPIGYAHADAAPDTDEDEAPLFHIADVHSPYESDQLNRARDASGVFSYGRPTAPPSRCVRQLKASLPILVALATLGVLAFVLFVLLPSWSAHNAARGHYDQPPADSQSMEEPFRPTTFRPDLNDAQRPPPATERVDVQLIPMQQVEVIPPLAKRSASSADGDYQRVIAPGASTWAVVLHVSRLRPLREMLDHLHTFAAAVKFDLFVTLAATMTPVDQQHARASIQAVYPQVVPAVVDRGAEVGGFLHHVLTTILVEPAYEYVVQLHTASWQARLLGSLMGTAMQARFIVDTMRRHPEIGLLGDADHVHVERRNEKPNYYYVHRLASQLDQEHSATTVEYRFLDGQMFVMRRSLVDALLMRLSPREIDRVLLGELNMLETFDPYWYLQQYFSPALQSIEAASAHWAAIGSKHGWLRSGMAARAADVPYTDFVPDAQMEHAWHRMWGLAAQNQGMLVAGVRSGQMLELPPTAPTAAAAAADTPAADAKEAATPAPQTPIEREDEPASETSPTPADAATHANTSP